MNAIDLIAALIVEALIALYVIASVHREIRLIKEDFARNIRLDEEAYARKMSRSEEQHPEQHHDHEHDHAAIAA